MTEHVVIRLADCEATVDLLLSLRAAIDTLEAGDMTTGEAAALLRAALDRWEIEGA